MFALGVLLVGAIFRLRVRQICRRMSARFDERLAERTRVARESHDTFLQTVQGSKMVADHALKDPRSRTCGAGVGTVIGVAGADINLSFVSRNPAHSC